MVKNNDSEEIWSRKTYDNWVAFEKEQAHKDPLKKKFMPIAKAVHDFIVDTFNEENLAFEIRYGDGTFSVSVPKDLAKSKKRICARFGLLTFDKKNCYLESIQRRADEKLPEYVQKKPKDPTSFGIRFSKVDELESIKEELKENLIKSYKILVSNQNEESKIHSISENENCPVPDDEIATNDSNNVANDIVKIEKMIQIADPSQREEIFVTRNQYIQGLAIKENNASAQYLLGLRNTIVTDQLPNYIEAAKWLHKAAEQGHKEAQYLLACQYKNGEGITENIDESIKWFKKAVGNGQYEAAHCLGDLYQWGWYDETNDNLIDADTDEAVKWYKKAAVQGHLESIAALGMLYRYEKNYKEAIKWLQIAAERGHNSSQVSIGKVYLTGEGVVKDPVVAVKWFRRAAQFGDCYAQEHMGDQYYEGNGVNQNFFEAAEWYQKAAEQGNASAEYKIGLMYIQGKGLSKDHNAGLKRIQCAIDKDATFAEKTGDLYYTGSIVDINKTEAANYYLLAAKREIATAALKLGRMYETGDGIKKDKEEAIQWFSVAAEAGEEEAEAYLASQGEKNGEIIGIKAIIKYTGSERILGSISIEDMSTVLYENPEMRWLDNYWNYDNVAHSFGAINGSIEYYYAEDLVLTEHIEPDDDWREDFELKIIKDGFYQFTRTEDKVPHIEINIRCESIGDYMINSTYTDALGVVTAVEFIDGTNIDLKTDDANIRDAETGFILRVKGEISFLAPADILESVRKKGGPPDKQNIIKYLKSLWEDKYSR